MTYLQRVAFCGMMGLVAFVVTIPLSGAMGLAIGYFGAFNIIPIINRFYAPIAGVLVVGPISLMVVERFFIVKRR